MLTEEEYKELKNRLENDPAHIKAILYGIEENLLASIGRLTFSLILWLLEMALKASGVLIWPLLGYLKSKGYINIDLEEIKTWLTG